MRNFCNKIEKSRRVLGAPLPIPLPTVNGSFFN